MYAVGDLLPPPSLALAHASFAEGMLIAETVAGQASPPIDYAGIPRVTFSTPEVASVGLTEAQAKEQGHEVVVNKFPFNATAKGLIHGQGGMVKVVAAKDGPVLGVHLVGARVTDLVAEAADLQLGGAADRRRPVHPPAPDPVRGARRGT